MLRVHRASALLRLTDERPLMGGVPVVKAKRLICYGICSECDHGRCLTVGRTVNLPPVTTISQAPVAGHHPGDPRCTARVAVLQVQCYHVIHPMSTPVTQVIEEIFDIFFDNFRAGLWAGPACLP